MKGKLIKYIGATEPLGEIEKGDSFYWRVHPIIKTEKTQTIDYRRVVCHPKWNTEIINDGGITT